jgi:cytochrome P450
MPAPSSRLLTISNHLVAGGAAEAGHKAETSAEPGFHPNLVGTDNLANERLALIPDSCPQPGEYNVADHVCGPLLSGVHKFDALRELSAGNFGGRNHLFQTELQKKYGDTGNCTNLVVPLVSFGKLTQTVLLSHPEDCERIARTHVTKQPNFKPVFNDSVISTTDNDHWKSQREHLVQAFLPQGSLSKIFPVSVDRARTAADRMAGMSQAGKAAVNVHDFLLHETNAQLQLGLFGTGEEFMEANNTKFRTAMKTLNFTDVRQYLGDLYTHGEANQNTTLTSAADEGGLEPEHRIEGPLSKLMAQSGESRPTKIGNAFIFAFAGTEARFSSTSPPSPPLFPFPLPPPLTLAPPLPPPLPPGHDTTGHTLTWLTYELARNPAIQARLQLEVDALFADMEAAGTDLAYSDLQKLPFMTRCVMETLRLWPAVPNGTFRQLQFDDTIKGAGGKDVLVKKGQYVQITTYARHRSKELWGTDADLFNPDREWDSKEVWFDSGFAAYSPSTPRFSPFTYPPRDCIGKNFAQMEMRTILAHLLKDFTFELAEPTVSQQASIVGDNRGTMGPGKSGVFCYCIPRSA